MYIEIVQSSGEGILAVVVPQVSLSLMCFPSASLDFVDDDLSYRGQAFTVHPLKLCLALGFLWSLSPLLSL
jgi:hypothetical protein